jgi:hypothetical protein
LIVWSVANWCDSNKRAVDKEKNERSLLKNRVLILLLAEL